MFFRRRVRITRVERIADGGHQIEYADEDPMIRKMFEEALAKNGVSSKMDEVLKLAS